MSWKGDPDKLLGWKTNYKIMVKLYICTCLYFCINNIKYGRINTTFLLVIHEKIFYRDGGVWEGLLFYFRFLCLISIKPQNPRIAMNSGVQTKWDFSWAFGDGTWQFITLFYFWIGSKLSTRKVNTKYSQEKHGTYALC